MKRREFIKFLAGAATTLTGTWQAFWPIAARAQYQLPPPNQAPPPYQGPVTAPADNSVGQVATLQGSATVTRGNAVTPLKITDPIYEKDTLQTALDSSLGITFDDETTFSLSPNTRIVVDEFAYQEGGNANAASFHVAAGTAAFVASFVAKTGDMNITTDTATLGIRGTTGVVEVPETGGAGEPTIKLYPDADGHVGQIEVFNRQGGRLGALTQGASAFTLRLGPGGRVFAAPYQIPPQEAARDRGVLQRLGFSHAIGRQMAVQRRQLRGPNRQGPNNQRPGGPQNFRPNGPQNFRQGGPQNFQPGGPRPFNRPFGGGGRSPPRKNSKGDRR
jgi:hypothetical protein